MSSTIAKDHAGCDEHSCILFEPRLMQMDEAAVLMPSLGHEMGLDGPECDQLENLALMLLMELNENLRPLRFCHLWIDQASNEMGAGWHRPDIGEAGFYLVLPEKTSGDTEVEGCYMVDFEFQMEYR